MKKIESAKSSNPPEKNHEMVIFNALYLSLDEPKGITTMRRAMYVYHIPVYKKLQKSLQVGKTCPIL